MLKLDNMSVIREKAGGKTRVLCDISLTLQPAKTLAVVGESGAGKSTLIAVILGLIKPSAGQITWNDFPTQAIRPSLVMQEPRAAFNPVLSLRQSVLEPIKAKRAPLPHDRLARLCDGLELPLELLERRPTEISIGQAQRMGILRALISPPALVLFDEPLSALDAVTQKHTARLIAQLQKEEGFAALIVTHDLGYATTYSDDIAVLKSGRIQELTPTRLFTQAPRSQYGRALFDAAFALGALEKAP